MKVEHCKYASHVWEYSYSFLHDIYFGCFQTVHYEGTLAETGEVFDTTREDNTLFSFELGKGSVIKAWDIAIKTMKVVKCLYSLHPFI
jgi:hypothetical protein